MTTVLKVGGSLLAAPQLREWLRTACTHGVGRVVIVPGGGPFADTVRAVQRQTKCSDGAAHSMALLGMAQFGLLLADFEASLAPARDPEQIQAQWHAHRVPIWLPEPEQLASQDIPESWDFTSDSLSLWLAGQLGSDRLVLVKSVSAGTAKRNVSALALAGLVDRAFASLSGHIACDVCVYGPDESAQWCVSMDA